MPAGQVRLTARRGRAPAKDAFAEASGFVAHPLLTPGAVAYRPFEVAMARESLAESTLVVLPTGLPKTAVAVLVAAERLRQAGGFVLAVAPSRPIARQLKAAFDSALSPSLRILEVHGRTSRAARQDAFEKGSVVVATPEGLASDLAEGRLDLGRCSLLVVDEAHRAVGDFAYVELVRALRRDRPGGLVLALAGSPGGDRRRTAAIMDVLGLRRVEARTREDEDVRPFLAASAVEVLEVELDEPLKVIQALLEREMEAPLAKLVSLGALPSTPTHLVGKRQLLAAGDMLRRQRGGDKGAFFEGLQAHAQAMLLVQALEICETRGARPLVDFLSRLGAEADAPRAERALTASEAVKGAARLAEAHAAVFHPKVRAAVALVRDLVRERPGARAWVIVPHRDTALAVEEALSAPPPLGPAIRTAMPMGRGPAAGSRASADREPAEALRDFSGGCVQVLVAAGSPREGLDTRDTDLVVFFEAAPAALRAIQGRGRSGRAGPGRVVVLVSPDTRDEPGLDAAAGRERRKQSKGRSVQGGLVAGRPERGPNQRLPFEVGSGPAQAGPLGEAPP